MSFTRSLSKKAGLGVYQNSAKHLKLTQTASCSALGIAMKEKLFGSYGLLPCKRCSKTVPSNCLKKHACGKSERKPPGQERLGVKCFTCGGDHFANECPKQERCSEGSSTFNHLESSPHLPSKAPQLKGSDCDAC